MLGRHLAIGLCALLLGGAALFAAPSSGLDPGRQALPPDDIRLHAVPVSHSPLRRIDAQPSDYLSRAEQLALVDPSWPRWLTTTDF